MRIFKLGHKILDIIEPNTHIDDLSFQIIDVWFDPDPEDLLDTSDFPGVVAEKPSVSIPFESEFFKPRIEFPTKLSLQCSLLQNGFTSTVLSLTV